MTQFPIKTIIHPTDFSDSSLDAFAHAMAFSLAAKCHLYIVHVAKDGEDRTCYSFPHLRDLLTLWRRIGPHERPEAIEALTGVKISKVAIGPGDARRCIDDFILGHGCDLMVLSTHHRNAVRRVVSPSVATGAADDSRIPTLFLRDDVKRFIDRVSGACHLETVLIPVGSEINEEVLQKIEAITDLVAPYARIRMLHVGERQPVIVYKGPRHRTLPTIDLRQGAVVETIVRMAWDIGADLIAMPTEGRHGLSDVLFGTTTEQVLNEAPCAVLAVPTR